MDRPATFIRTYAAMSDHNLAREREAIFAALQDGSRRTRIKGTTNTRDIEAIRDVCLDEIRKRSE